MVIMLLVRQVCRLSNILVELVAWQIVITTVSEVLLMKNLLLATVVAILTVIGQPMKAEGNGGDERACSDH